MAYKIKKSHKKCNLGLWQYYSNTIFIQKSGGYVYEDAFGNLMVNAYFIWIVETTP